MTVKRVCPYPVGEIRMSVNATDPATIWPNTLWERIQDCMLMMAGTTYSPGSTGGSATHTHVTGNCTLTVDQIPSHTHSVGAHAHGLNSHTHTYSKSNTPTAAGGQHAHQQVFQFNSTYTNSRGVKYTDGETVPTAAINTKDSTTHSHTVNFTSTNSGAASGSTANSAAFNSGSAGGGKAHSHGDTGSASNLPPYLAVYCWKRTA